MRRRMTLDEKVNAWMLLATFGFWTVTLGILAVFPKDSLLVTMDKYFLNEMLPWLMVAGLVWMATRPRF